MATQYGEDISILKYFEGRTLRFLDVGAGDGVTFSNTEPLLRVGWSGIMVEPAISQLRWLIENHSESTMVEIIPAAVLPVAWDETGKLLRNFFDCRDYSSLSVPHCRKVHAQSNGAVTFRHRPAVCIKWADIREAPFHFVNIDVEGLNTELLRELPFERFQPEMVCIEIDPESDLPEMMDICNKNGLGFAKRIGGNLLAARKEIR